MRHSDNNVVDPLTAPEHGGCWGIWTHENQGSLGIGSWQTNIYNHCSQAINIWYGYFNDLEVQLQYSVYVCNQRIAVLPTWDQ